MLRVRGLRVDYGATTVIDDLDLDVGAAGNPVTVVLGPSGCGKSTLVRAIAGVEPVAAGVISMNGIDLHTTPPHRRDFGVVFQDGQLMSGRSVAWNVGYGLRAHRWPRREVAARVAELLDLVGLPGTQRRRVADLSGGQAQRIALARALAPRPRLLLLDEPLSSLDRLLRDRLAADMSQIIRDSGTPTVMVTHDHAEAVAMADRIAVMSDGRVLQDDPPDRVWSRPASEWVARFVGCTAVIDGTVMIDGTVVIDGTRREGVVTTELGPLPLPADARADRGLDGSRMRIGLRPRAVRTTGSGVDAVVRAVRSTPDDRLVVAELASGLRVDAVATTDVAVGDRVRLAVDPDRVAIIGRRV